MLTPKIKYFVLLVLCEIYGVFAGSLPTEVQKCKVSDNTCIADKINEIVQRYPNGNAEFGLPDLTKLVVPNIKVAEASEGQPVQLLLDIKNAILMGIEKMKITSVKGFNADPKEFTAKVAIPQLKLNGRYSVEGKILLLPIRGKGNVELLLNNCEVTVRINVKLEPRDGKNYLKVIKCDVSLQPKGFSISLDNLFDGDKELMEAMNKTINENWADVWEELKPYIRKSIGDVIQNMITPTFDSLSYDDFYAN